jgi:hypothetical protein
MEFPLRTGALSSNWATSREYPGVLALAMLLATTSKALCCASIDWRATDMVPNRLDMVYFPIDAKGVPLDRVTGSGYAPE